MRKIYFVTLNYVLPFLFIFLLLFIFYQNNKSYYNRPYDHNIFLKKYNTSQWANPESKTSIGDSELYTFAGVSYLKGIDPVLLNPEMPPFGKMLIGLIALSTGLQNWSGLVFGFLSLVALYYLALYVLKKKIYAYLITFLVFLEKIFQEQLTTNLLDLPQLFFLTSAFLFYLKGRNRTIFFLISGLFMGAFLASKVYLLGIVALFSFSIFHLLSKYSKKKLFFFIIISLLFYLLTYLPYFYHDHSLREFLSLHKFIYIFYEKSLVSVFPGSPFYLLFFNRWETWFGSWYGEHKVIFSDVWSITWPIITLLFLVEFILALRNRLKNILPPTLLLICWCVCYLFFLFNNPLWPRYFLLLTPFLYILFFEFIFIQGKIINIGKFIKQACSLNLDISLRMLIFTIVILGTWFFLIGGNHFLFTSEIARDWSMAGKIYQFSDFKSVFPLFWPYYTYLAIFFLLFDGFPLGFYVAWLILILTLSYIFMFKFKKYLLFKYCFLLLCLLIFGSKFQLLARNSNDLYLNKIKVVSDIIEENKSGRYGLKSYLGNKFLEDESYPFLFSWFGKRIYHDKLENIDTEKPKEIYLILQKVDKKNLDRGLYPYSDYGQESSRLSFPFETTVVKRELLP